MCVPCALWWASNAHSCRDCVSAASLQTWGEAGFFRVASGTSFLPTGMLGTYMWVSTSMFYVT